MYIKNKQHSFQLKQIAIIIVVLICVYYIYCIFTFFGIYYIYKPSCYSTQKNNFNKIGLITFSSGGVYEANAKRLLYSAEAQVDYAHIEHPDAVDVKFLNKNKNIFEQKRGFGYWLWKPYIILKAMHNATDGDIIVYTDGGGYEFTTETIMWVKQQLKHMDILLVTNKPNEKCVYSNTHTKGDVYMLFNTKPSNTTQVWAGFLAIRKNFYTSRFVSEWLTYAQDARALTDIESITPNPSEFIENRHDQAILSILAETWNIELRFLAHHYLKTHKFDLLKTKHYIKNATSCIFV
jgi:hypothetical protein